MYKKDGQKGFTLIELLVVIAIIGLLSSVVLASLNGARKKARDARRLSDIKSLQSALELYYDSNSNAYPATLAALVTGGQISVVPTDPSGGTAALGYVQGAGGQSYGLAAIMENAGQTSGNGLNADYDGALVITVNGVASNCNVNAGAATETIY